MDRLQPRMNGGSVFHRSLCSARTTPCWYFRTRLCNAIHLPQRVHFGSNTNANVVSFFSFLRALIVRVIDVDPQSVVSSHLRRKQSRLRMRQKCPRPPLAKHNVISKMSSWCLQNNLSYEPHLGALRLL